MQNWIWTLSLAFLLLHPGASLARPHPIRTAGELQTIYSEVRDERTDRTSTNWIKVASIRADTYIWHPWFALLSGGLSLSNNESSSDNSSESESDALSGSIDFQLFPTSRFPFQFFASKSRFEQDSSVSNSVFSQSTLGMRQIYRSLDARQRYIANYQRQKQDIPGEADAETEAFSLGAGHILTNHRFTSSLGYSESFQEGSENQSEFALAVKHGYTGSETVTLDNQFSASQSDNDFSRAASALKTQQFTSATSWSPRDNRKLRVSGNLRVNTRERTISLFSLTNEQPRGTVTSKEERANISQGLFYQISEFLTFNQAFSLDDIRTDGLQQTVATESAGLDYSPNPLDLSLGTYSWFATINISNQHGENIASTRSLDGQLGHSLSSQLVVTPDFSLTAGVAQNLSYNKTIDADSDGSISHSASIGWSGSSLTSSSSARASISDSRNLSGQDFSNQIFNVSLDHRVKYDRFTNISGEMSYQRSQFKTGPPQNNANGTESLSAQLTYTDSKFMNVAGMLFKSSLHWDTGRSLNQDELTTESDDPESATWKNVLSYNAGLFESRISLDYIKKQNNVNRTIIIELTRRFGDL